MDAGGVVGRTAKLRTEKSCGPGTPGLVLSARAIKSVRDSDYEVTDTGESTK